MSNTLPPPANLVPHPPKTFGPQPAPLTQAARVFKKFGGVPNLQKALKAANPAKKWSISAIYRWDMPRSSGGSNGIIPGQALPDVIKAARREGFLLTPEDLYPTAENR